jgi:hypothetical protein
MSGVKEAISLLDTMKSRKLKKLETIQEIEMERELFKDIENLNKIVETLKEVTKKPI